MTTHEAQPGTVGPRDDRALRARHVGHGRVRPEARRERAAELVDEVEAGERRRGEDHELGALDRRSQLRRRGVDHAGRQGGRRSVTARAPGGEAIGWLARFRSPPEPDGPGDRPADEPEPDDRDPHGPMIVRSAGGSSAGRARTA